MSVPFEAWSWTPDRLIQEIALRLPPDWGFEFGQQQEDFLWYVQISDAQKNVMWKGDETVPNLVLLNAFAWVELRSTPAPSNSPWAPRRQDIDPRRLHEEAFRVRSEDPPDLDPSEVDAVYSNHPHKK